MLFYNTAGIIGLKTDFLNPSCYHRMIKQGHVYWAIRSGSKADCDIYIRMGMRFSFSGGLCHSPLPKTHFLQQYGKKIEMFSKKKKHPIHLKCFSFWGALSLQFSEKVFSLETCPGETAPVSLFRRIKCSSIVKLPSRYVSKTSVRISIPLFFKAQRTKLVWLDVRLKGLAM